MDCFPDYCLACDKQIPDGLYCSQTCRLADLERACSTPTSPLSPQSFSMASVSLLSAFNSIVPVESAASTVGTSYRTTSTVSLNSLQLGQQRPPLYHTSSAPSTPSHSLSSSSSRSSLSTSSSPQSTSRSRPTSDALSQEAKDELKIYFDAIEARQRRRRSYPPPQQVQDPHPVTTVSGFYDD